MLLLPDRIHETSLVIRLAGYPIGEQQANGALIDYFRSYHKFQQTMNMIVAVRGVGH